jgi:4-amino-4-deoxy-L-arabinose transferase-like glycosyltransferase
MKPPLTTQLSQLLRGEIYPAALAALFATLAALAFLAVLPAGSRANESADYADFYAPMARSLLAGDGFWNADEGTVATRYPPGFPAVLAAAIGAGRLFGISEDLAVRLLCLLGFASTAVTLFRLGRIVFGGAAGLVAAAAFALYPPHLYLVKQPNSELVFMPLFLFGLELAWRSRRDPHGWRLALAAGASFGLASLVRPIALALFVPLGVFLYFFAEERFSGWRRLLVAAALAAGQLVVMAPWAIFLHYELDRWIPLSTGGRLSMLDGLTIAAKKNREGPPLPPAVVELMFEIDAARPELRSPGAIFAFLGEKAIREPGTVVQLLAIKAARSFYGTDSLNWEGPLLVLQVPLLLVMLITLVQAWRHPRREPWRAFAVLTILVLLYFLAMTMMVLSILRYMVPALAAAFVVLAAWSVELFVRLTVRWWRRFSAAPGDPS